MAKGYSTFQQLGKIDGRKYYRMKGVDGIVSSNINTGMSNKVKTAAAYANTRLNNAEFGAAGNMAGTIIRALTQRWRCITIAFATAKFLPSIKKSMSLDTSNPWGQRTLTGTTWQDGMRDNITALSKNSFAEMIGIDLSATINSQQKIALAGSGVIAQSDFLEGKGVDGVDVDFTPIRVNAPEYDENIEGYTPALLASGETVSDTLELHDSNEVSQVLDLKGAKLDGTKVLAGVLVVAKPYRMVSGEKYYAQELCSHQVVKINQAA